jgi:uncharacterized protein
MSEEFNTPGEVTSDDKLWAALVWLPITPLWPIIAIIVLLLDDKKNRPFIRYHAVLSIVTGLVGWIASTICIGVIVLVAMFYFAFKAYQGEYIEIPFLTDFCRKQGWI